MGMEEIGSWNGEISNAAEDGLKVIAGAASALSGAGDGLQNDTPGNASSFEDTTTKHGCSGLACVDNKVDDQQLLSSLGLNALMGVGTLLLFGFLHSRMAVYKIRTMLPQVTIKPPRLKQKGWQSYWRWIYLSITTSDQDLLASAGMDALMLVKTMSFGIQLFVPLTVVAICVLIPMHKSGGKSGEGGRHFESMTISNTPPGSRDFWVHLACIYAFIGYALLLLYIHQKRFVELRHHYLTAGDDPNLWRIRYQSVEEQPEPQSAPTVADAAAHITKFLKKAAGLERVIDKEYAKPKGLLSTAAKTDRIQDAKKLLVDLQSKDENTDGNDDLTRELNIDPKTVEEQEEGLEAAASGPSGSSGEASEEQESSLQADQNGEKVELGKEISNIEEISCLQQLSDPYSLSRKNIRSESMPESNVPTVLKWWNVDDEHFDEEDSLPRHHLQRGVHTARPSVRFLKTVNTEDLLSGEPVAVNAQQYCVLLTDVPKLERILKREEQKLERKKRTKTTTLSKIFSAIWSWAAGGFNFKDYNPTRSSENEHLLGKRDRGVDPEVMKKYGSGFLPVSSKSRKTEANNSDGKKLPRAPSRWGKVAEKVRTHEIFHLDECVVANSFKSLFPDDFVKALPIRVHKKIDLMLNEWEKVAAALEVQEYKLSKTGNRRIVYPQRRWWSWLLFCQYGNGPPDNSINHLNEKLTEIEERIITARRTIMMNTPSSTWLLIFRTQFAATVAAQTLLHSESGHKFQAHPAPGPDEMNWQALWKTWSQKDIRRVLVFPLVAFVIMFPLGLFAGGLSKLFIFFCDPNNKSYYMGDSYCGDGEGSISIRNLITAWMPSILVSIWQNAVMPNLLYCLVQMQASCISLSAIDREIAGLFFLWDVLNIFVGGMLGGTIFSRLTDMVKGTVSIVEVLGRAVPASSNFFISYVVLRAFFLVPYQLMLPHPGVWQYLIRLAGGIKPRTARAKTMVWKPRSVRYGREYGIFMLVYVITLVYAVIAPIIIPLSLVYFCMSWVVWRYQVLYVFVRKYEGGGQMWPFVFNRILVILWLFQVFTSCILTMKKAYWQGAILWVTVPVILIKYWRYCEGRFKSGMDYVPLEMAKMAPSAEIDPKVYTPPALIQGCAGWHPEYMTAWEGWGAPRYCWIRMCRGADGNSIDIKNWIESQTLIIRFYEGFFVWHRIQSIASSYKAFYGHEELKVMI